MDWLAPDTAGHGFGYRSKEYLDAIVMSDRETQRIVEFLERTDLFSKTILVVTTDHGFAEHDHEGDDN